MTNDKTQLRLVNIIYCMEVKWKTQLCDNQWYRYYASLNWMLYWLCIK